MQFISIEQIQVPTNTTLIKNLRIIRVDLNSLVTFFRKPKTFRYLKAMAYYYPVATPTLGEPLKVFNGWLTPIDNNIRTVSNYVPTSIQSPNGGDTTWRVSKDIMFFEENEAWRGEVESMNDFYINLIIASGPAATTDTIVTKILLGYDV